MNRMVLSGHLEAAGFDVVAAADGQTALAVLATARFDLAVIDVLMPGLDGFETCRRIRHQPALATLPLLLLTALDYWDMLHTALDAGANDILGKPFQRAQLLDRICDLLRQTTRSPARERPRPVDWK
jgi:two-component system, cell cycle response regulator